MAVTPRSIFKSPVMILALLLSLGIAAMGISLLFFNCSKSALQEERFVVKEVVQVKTIHDYSTCDHVMRDKPSDMDLWSERDFLETAYCFEGADEHRNAVRISDQGLVRYPVSEVLFNTKGYNLIELRQYDQAVETLELGLQRVGVPSTGTMENNLAWAGIFEPRSIPLTEARRHYTASLRKDASSCEAIHTGLWVEYAVASQSTGSFRIDAMSRFDALRARYRSCEGRVEHESASTIYEVIGAGVLDREMRKLRFTDSLERGHAPRIEAAGNDLVDAGIDELRERSMSQDVQSICREAAPVRTAWTACQRAVTAELGGF